MGALPLLHDLQVTQDVVGAGIEGGLQEGHGPLVADASQGAGHVDEGRAVHGQLASSSSWVSMPSLERYCPRSQA